MMRKLVILLGVVGLLGGLAAVPAWAAAPEATAVAVEEPAQGAEPPFEVACRRLDEADVAALEARTADEEVRQQQAYLRGHALPTVAVPAGADAEIHVFSVDPMSGVATTTLAYRANGAWTVSGLQDTRRMKDRPARYRKLKTKTATLDAEATRRLELVIGSACFWAQPPLLYQPIPLADGTEWRCFDGLDTVVEVRVGQRRWEGFMQCAPLGPAGQIAALLWDASVPPSWMASTSMIYDPKHPDPDEEGAQEPPTSEK